MNHFLQYKISAHKSQLQQTISILIIIIKKPESTGFFLFECLKQIVIKA